MRTWEIFKVFLRLKRKEIKQALSEDWKQLLIIVLIVLLVVVPILWFLRDHLMYFNIIIWSFNLIMIFRWLRSNWQKATWEVKRNGGK